MTDAQRYKYEKYNREIVFMDESADDFPANSAGKLTVSKMRKPAQ